MSYFLRNDARCNVNKNYTVVVRASWPGQRLNVAPNSSVEIEVNYEKLYEDILFSREDTGRFPLESEPEDITVTHVPF
jgi:hypothetical protein